MSSDSETSKSLTIENVGIDRLQLLHNGSPILRAGDERQVSNNSEIICRRSSRNNVVLQSLEEVASLVH